MNQKKQQFNLTANVPKISVIISSYNHAAYIHQAVQSVLDQTEQDFEILIADDASTDNTMQVLAQFTDPRIHIFQFKENRKEYMKNICLENASGEYIAILNSDDYMHPQRLAIQINFLETNHSYLAVFSPFQKVDVDGNLLNKPEAINRSRHEWLRHFLDVGNGLGHSCGMIRKSFFDNHGHYNRWLLLVADLDLWIRICLEGEIHVLDQALTFLRTFPNEGNLGGNNPAANNRRKFEFPIILEHFLTKKGINQLAEIFPEVEVPEKEWKRKFFLADHLIHHRLSTVRLWANRIKYDLITQQSDNQKEIVESESKSYYSSIAQTTYDSELAPMGRLIVRNHNTKQNISELPFITQFGKEVHYSFEIDVTKSTVLIFIPSNEPCEFSINSILVESSTTLNLYKKTKVAGTTIEYKAGKFANYGKKPIIRIPPNALSIEGKIELKINMNILKDLSSFSAYLASQ